MNLITPVALNPVCIKCLEKICVQDVGEIPEDVLNALVIPQQIIDTLFNICKITARKNATFRAMYCRKANMISVHVDQFYSGKDATTIRVDVQASTGNLLIVNSPNDYGNIVFGKHLLAFEGHGTSTTDFKFNTFFTQDDVE